MFITPILLCRLVPIKNRLLFPRRHTPLCPCVLVVASVNVASLPDRHYSYPFARDGSCLGTMIITRPSCVNVDSGDQSGLPARTGNNDSLLLALWSWRSWQKRQESVSPRSIGDVAPSSPPIALPSFVPTTIPSSSSVVTSHTRSFSSSDELDPTSPSPSIPLETPPVSSNTLPPRSTPPVIYPTESDTGE